MAAPRKPLPPQWTELGEAHGIDTYADLVERTGLAKSTVARFVEGAGDASDETLAAMSDAFHTSIERLLATREGRERRDPFVMPPGADILNRQQRDAVRRVINEFIAAESRAQASTGRQGQDIATTRRKGENLHPDRDELKASLAEIPTEILAEEYNERRTADLMRQWAEQPRDPWSLTDMIRSFVASAERAADAAHTAHEIDKHIPANPQLAYSMRKSLANFEEAVDQADQADQAELRILLGQAREWIGKFPSEQQLRGRIADQGGDPDEVPALGRQRDYDLVQARRRGRKGSDPEGLGDDEE